MIDYLAHLWAKFLILLFTLGWAALLFWGAIFIAEKILRFVYQDVPRALFISKDAHELEPAECRDCGGTYMLDDAGRCDFCVSIECAVRAWAMPLDCDCEPVWTDEPLPIQLDRHGLSRADRQLHRELRYQSGSRAHDYDPLDFEDHDLHDHEDLVDGTGRVIKRICLP